MPDAPVSCCTTIRHLWVRAAGGQRRQLVTFDVLSRPEAEEFLVCFVAGARDDAD